MKEFDVDKRYFYEELTACPECGGINVEATQGPNIEGYTEYRCHSCGHYFVTKSIHIA